MQLAKCTATETMMAKYGMLMQRHVMSVYLITVQMRVGEIRRDSLSIVLSGTVVLILMHKSKQGG